MKTVRRALLRAIARATNGRVVNVFDAEGERSTQCVARTSDGHLKATAYGYPLTLRDDGTTDRPAFQWWDGSRAHGSADKTGIAP